MIYRIENFESAIEHVPVQGQIRCSTEMNIPACSRVAKWRFLMFPRGLQQEGKFAVFLDLENGGKQPPGYLCSIQFTLSLLEAVEAGEVSPSEQPEGHPAVAPSAQPAPLPELELPANLGPTAEGEGGASEANNHDIKADGSTSAVPVVPGGKVFARGTAKFSQNGHHEYRAGEWDRGFQALFPLNEILQRKEEFMIDGAIAIRADIEVRAEYVQRALRNTGWAMRPPCQDVVLQCPHCDTPFLVAAGNCLIFRHGVYKDTGMQVSPHASKEMCERLIRDDLIYGCGMPVKAVYDYEKKEWSSAKCGWV